MSMIPENLSRIKSFLQERLSPSKGKTEPIPEGEEATEESIQNETLNPLSPKEKAEKVQAFLDYQRLDAFLEREAPELHPPEEISKIREAAEKVGWQKKNLLKKINENRALSTITRIIFEISENSLERIGKKEAVSNFFEGSKQTKKEKEKTSIQRRIGKLSDLSSERITNRLQKSLDDAFKRPEIQKELGLKVKSIQRIKFELLEEEIKDDRQIEHDKIHAIFETHVGQQVGKKQYSELMDAYVIALSENEELSEEQITQFIEIVKRSGTEKYQKIIPKGDLMNLKVSEKTQLWNTLVSIATESVSKETKSIETEAKRKDILAYMIGLGSQIKEKLPRRSS